MRHLLPLPVAGLLLLMVATIFSTNEVVRNFIPTFAEPEPIEWQAEWVKAPEPGYQAFFRRTLDLPFMPDQAWIAVSSNDYILFVNGVEIARNRYVNNMGQAFQTRSGMHRSQASYSAVADLSRAPELRRSPNQEKLTPYYISLINVLRPGRNVIALAIEDSQDAPSFSTTGVIRDRTHSVSLDSRAKDWTASITPQAIGLLKWSAVQEKEDGWAPAVRSDENHSLFTTSEPGIWRAPAPTGLMTGPTVGRHVAFRTTLTGMGWHGVERGAWIRIHSNWPYTITIDDRVFASGAPSNELVAREITAYLDKPTSTVLVRLERPEFVQSGASPRLSADFIIDGSQVTGSEKWSVLSDAGGGSRGEFWVPASDAGSVTKPAQVALLTKSRPVDWSATYWTIWVVLLAASVAVWAMISRLVSPVANTLSISPGRVSGGLIAVPALGAILISLMRLRYKESDTILWFYDPANTALLSVGLVAVLGTAILLMTVRVAPDPVLPSAQTRSENQARIISTVLLFVILGLATYLRMYNISVEDLQADENVSFDAARGIMRTGLPEAASGVLYTRSPLYHYMLAGWLTLFGDTIEVARSMSVVAGVGVIVVAYHFALQVRTGRPLALALALWLAVDPWQIIVSLNIRFYQQMQFFGLLSFLFFLRGFVFSRNRRLQFWFFVFCTAATLSQEVFVTMFPGLCIAGYFYYRPFRLAEDWRIIAGTMAVLSITIVDMAIFQVMCLTQHVNVGTTSGSILQLHTLDVPAFTASFLSGTLRSHFFVTVLLIAVLVMRTRTSNPGVGVGLVLVIVGLVVTTVLVVQVANRYLFILKPVLLITVCAAVREIVIDWAARLYPGPNGLLLRRRWTGMVFTLLIAAAVADSEVWRTTGSHTHKTILQHYDAYQYIAENMRAGDKVVSVSPMSAAIVLGELDYYLMESLYFDEVYISREAGIIDRWSGGQLISNVARLQQVFLENERVWVMMNIQEGGKFSDELFRYISSVTEVQKTFFGGEVHLWDRSKGVSVPIAWQGRDLVSF